MTVIAPARPAGRSTARDPLLDNAKFLGIVLVVSGHLVEDLRDVPAAHALYFFVYLFHMPLFIVVSGYLSRNFTFSPGRARKLISGLAVPYVIFGAAYSLPRYLLYGKLEISLLGPYYLTWFLMSLFLMSLFLWRLSTPVWQQLRHPLVIAVGLCLLSGTSALPDELSMNRTFGLLPFYVLGSMCSVSGSRRSTSTSWARGPALHAAGPQGVPVGGGARRLLGLHPAPPAREAGARRARPPASPIVIRRTARRRSRTWTWDRSSHPVGYGTSGGGSPFCQVMVRSRANCAAGGLGNGTRLCHGAVIRGNLRIRGAARSGENDRVTRVVGRQGRVTGKIGPGLVGEVMVPIRGGVEAFYAYPSIPDEEIPVGSIVVVVEYSPPRTVYVARAVV